MSWWANPKNAKKWIDQVESHKDDLSYTEQPNIVLDALKPHRAKFMSVAEVGSGTGHLIGAVQKRYKNKRCFGLDVNLELLRHVKVEHPKVRVGYRDVTSYESMDPLYGAFDLVFTYQMLQHIRPDKIDEAVDNLISLANKELWLFEGIGKKDYKHCDQTSKAHDGSWVYHFDKMIECYEVSVPKSDRYTCERQRLYKIKV